MKAHFANYRKIWWLLSPLLGGAGALASFILHGSMRTLGMGPWFSFELLLIFGVCVALATTYLPVLFLSDVLSKRSALSAFASTIFLSIFIATLILMRKHFEFGSELLLRGLNAYLYSIVMGVCSLYGWQRSKGSTATESLQKTGYYLSNEKQIVGPQGPTGLFFNEDYYVIKDGVEIGVYVEDGAFFREGNKLFFLFSICSPTGHELTETGEVLGRTDKLPWSGL